MNHAKLWLLAGTVSGFLSVALGAFGAHALTPRLGEKALSIYQTAHHYQLAHALALIALGIHSRLDPTAASPLAGWAFTLGSLIFSGSLYALALTDIRILGAITPIGGVGFLLGWAAWGYAIWGGK
jgi:uncharacterized membrane protein YgdD (TMEM256/DUF423 family)